MSNWKTQKGDEWCYENGFIQATGDLNREDGAFMVRDIASSTGTITEKLLLKFLCETKEFFSQSGIFIKQSRLEPAAEKALASLQIQGLVCGKAVDSQKSLIEVTGVQAKKWWSLW